MSTEKLKFFGPDGILNGAPIMKPFQVANEVEAFHQLALKLTCAVHTDVVMTETMLGRMMVKFRGRAEGPTKAHAGDAMYGMSLHTRATELGARFRAMLLAAIDGKSVLLVFDDGHADTLR